MRSREKHHSNFTKVFLIILSSLLANLISFQTLAKEMAPLDKLIGIWQSPDGTARMSYEPEMDGAWLTSKTWFKKESVWHLVGYGGVYYDPTNERYQIKSRTREMNGLVMFESILSPIKDGYHLITTAYAKDGKGMQTEEEWHVPDRNTFTYIIYDTSGGTRKPFMSGSWVRVEN